VEKNNSKRAAPPEAQTAWCYESKVEDAEPNPNGNEPIHALINIAKNMGGNNGVFSHSIEITKG
jgi:hypothetical protein